MFTFNETNYELEYSLKRLERIENLTGKATVPLIQETNGYFPIGPLKQYFGMALKKAGADTYLDLQTAYDIFAQIVKEMSYAEVCGLVLEALSRDCPFLFPKD